MEKELAIDVEIKEVFKGRYAWKVKNINLFFDNFIFKDKELNIQIECFRDRCSEETFKITSGSNPCIIICEDILMDMYTKERLLSVIEEINKKYTRINGPRVRRGDAYFYIDDTFKVSQQIDADQLRDFERYRLGNYFRTFSEAKKASESFKELWYKITYGDNNGNS